MGNEEIEKARLKVLETEAEKNLAEKEKLVREKEEIDKKLKKFDISLSTAIKTLIGGIVAGILLWAVGLDYMFKINKVNVELKHQLEEENKKVEKDREIVAKENIKLQKEKEDLKEELNMAQQSLIDLSRKTEAAADADAKKKFEATIVAGVHRLEDQSSRISVAKIPTQMSKPTSDLKNEGWVYLGEYDNDGNWKSINFDFPSTIAPQELVGQTISVMVHSVNVRTRMYSGDVLKVLMKDQVVSIAEVDDYAFTNYFWAKVKY